METCCVTVLNVSYRIGRAEAKRLISKHVGDLARLILREVYAASDEYADYKAFKNHLLTLAQSFNRSIRMRSWRASYTDDLSYIDYCKYLIRTIKYTPAKLVFHRLLLREIDTLANDDPLRFHIGRRIKSNDQIYILTLPIHKIASIWLELNLMICENIQ